MSSSISPDESSSILPQLLISSRANDLPTVKSLVEAWIQDTNPSPPRGPRGQPNQPLWPAWVATAENECVEAFSWFLDHPVFSVNEVKIGGIARVALKCRQGEKYPLLDILLQHGYNINLNLGHVGDLLVIACCANNAHLISYLLLRGADPNANTWGNIMSPLECAAKHADGEVMGLLLGHGAIQKGRRALCVAAEAGRADNVEWLLDHEAVIDEVPDDEDILDILGDSSSELGTALHEASKKGHATVCKLLVDRGADVSVKDRQGRTAREVAEANQHWECAHLL